MERNSPGALRICSLHITREFLLSRSGAAAFGRGTADDAACGRAGASGDAATFLGMRVCRRSVASHARLLARRPQHLWRRLRRHSARPSDALRCCRIRLHWPATTPRPRGVPPNARELRNGTSFKTILKDRLKSFYRLPVQSLNRTQSLPQKGVRDSEPPPEGCSGLRASPRSVINTRLGKRETGPKNKK
jgi:hypothetical protein